jgi:hypothetical protein
MITKDVIKKVFEAEGILNKNCAKDGYSPSDLTQTEYIQEIFQIVNDNEYRKMMIENNKD